MFEWYKRWRHSRGYGIHSPSAYRIISEVLCPSPRYGYYAYRCLKKFKPKYHTAREMRLLVRVLSDLFPSTIVVYGVKELFETATKTLPNAEIYYNEPVEAELFIFGKNSRCTEISSKARYVLCFDAQSPLLDEYISRMIAGHIFQSKNHAFIDNRSDLPLQTFLLNF